MLCALTVDQDSTSTAGSTRTSSTTIVATTKNTTKLSPSHRHPSPQRLRSGDDGNNGRSSSLGLRSHNPARSDYAIESDESLSDSDEDDSPPRRKNALNIGGSIAKRPFSRLLNSGSFRCLFWLLTMCVPTLLRMMLSHICFIFVGTSP